jgi:hypothetical protein
MIGIMFAAALTATQVGTCKVLEEFAYMASLANQKGVPASKIIEIAGDDDIFQGIAMDAIALPRYSTEEYQIKESRSFATDVASLCYREMEK